MRQTSIQVLAVLSALAAGAMRVSASAPQQYVITDPKRIAATTLPVAAAGPAAGKRDRKLQPVALCYGAPPAGVAVAQDNSIFLTFPRWGDAVHWSCGVLRDGPLIGFPDEASHRQTGDNPDKLVSTQGIDLDARGRVWLLDAGSAMLRAYDPAIGTVVKRITFSPEVLKAQTYANDVRVDVTRGTDGFAYVSDSAAGGIIVVDLGSGDSWRRLTKSPAAHAAKNFVATVEGEELLYRPVSGKPTPMRGNCDGIALSPDGKTLYCTPFSSHEIYAVDADLLADRSKTDAQVEATIRTVTSKPSANDGLLCDAADRVYSTDYESSAIRRVAGSGGEAETIVQDERLLWPDALFLRGGYLYITTNQLNRMAGLHSGHDLRRPPFTIFRYPIDAKGIGEK